MNYYVIIATRTTEKDRRDSKLTVARLEKYFTEAGWQVKFMENESSIWAAHRKGVKEFDVQDEDAVILCHDDIEILLQKEDFNMLIGKHLADPETGFLGVAGSSIIDKHIGWFQCAVNNQSGHGGCYHGDSAHNMFYSHFGHVGPVIALDGLFLATTGKVLNSIKIAKPKALEPGCNWDWYDFFYTVQAHIKKFKNRTIALPIRHESPGRYPKEFFDAIPTWQKILSKHLPLVVR